MPTALLDTVEDPELKAHHLAYFKLIQSVLGKRPGSPDQKKQVYQKLQKHLVANAHNVDDLIDLIPEMASAMGVPAQTLSSFISQNFFRALEMARKELQSTPDSDSGAGGPAQDTDPNRDHDLIGEILEVIGPVVQAPNKFVPADMGTIKMVTPNGEKLPTSLTGEAPAEQAEESSQTGPAEPAAKTTAAKPSQEAKTVTGKKPAVLAEKEEPLIQEILNKFGNHLDVHEKLEPAAFPKNFAPSSEASGGDSAASGASAGSPSGAPGDSSAGGPDKAVSSGVKTNEVPRSAGPTIQWPDEDKGLIEEILEQFGNYLDVHGKLEPSDGFPVRGGSQGQGGSGGAASGAAGTSGSAGSHAASSAGSGAGPSGESGGAPDLEQARPRALVTFARYTEIRSHLAKFQKAGDQQGYKEFLHQLSEEEKLIVPLRNLENKIQKNSALRVGDELYNLSVQLSQPAEKLAGFRQAMIRYDRIQLLLNDFVQRVKKGPAPLMKAVQSIWSQVRLLLNQVDQLETMRSQMKFLLLGIQDPDVKKRTQEILESLLNRAHSIYAESE